MAKNIVICCDGTGNEFGDDNSNVVKLRSVLEISARQVAFYHPGVGTMGSPNARLWIQKKWDALRGLAFGYGITEDISLAYECLMETYEPGDSIFLFGFSRGAYTARALGGLLHMYGLLYPGNKGLIPYITERFAERTRQAQGMSHTFEVAEGFKQTFCRDVLIYFVGVWDTVSSVGWIADPVIIPFTANNPIMEIGRHAVSIDERRCFFRDNLWGKPLEEGDPGFRVKQDIKQVWFAGVHSDVGGSYPEGESGLSKITLEWMLREATQKGLLIHDEEAKRVLGVGAPAPFVRPDPTDGQHESLTAAWWPVELLPHFKYDKIKQKPHWTWPPFGKHRHLPKDAVLHESVYARIRNVGAYRPANAMKVDHPVEQYVPLFADAPGYTKTPDGTVITSASDNKKFADLDAPGKVQSILNFKVDANPLLQCPPNPWPKFPMFAALLAVVTTLLIRPESYGWWILGEVAGFWLLRLGFRELYRHELVKQYEQNKDEQAGSTSKSAPASVRSGWKAACQITGGLIACVLAGFLLKQSTFLAGAGPLARWIVDYPNYFWWILALLVFVAAGLLPAAVSLARTRAYNVTLAAWTHASGLPEFQQFSSELLKYRRSLESSRGAHA